ncbi:MAG: sulfatase [Planctomycetota bacterium]
MRISNFATLWLVSFSIAAAADVAKEAEKPRNVLMLVADDLGGGDLGCYGHPVIRSPNIDALAAQGTRFSHAFATTASCSASRSVLYTGLHNHANGQYGHAHAEHNFHQRPSVQTVFMLLKDQGYRTGLIGKRHVLPDEKYPIDFEPKVNARNPEKMTQLANEFLTDDDPRPFFLVLGFVEPHRAAHGFGEEPAPKTAAKYSPEEAKVPHFLPDNAESRAELAEYYQAISRLDRSVGKVLESLKRSGKWDDTLILFLSDNGMPFPGAKTNVYEPGVRLPLIVRSPESKKRGIVNSAMISFTDITPTILDWAKAKPPTNYRFHGRSFLEIVDQENPEGWNEVFLSHTFHEVTMYYPMRGIRNRRFKYIWNIAAPLTFPHASDLFASPTWQRVWSRKEPKYGSRTVDKYLHRDEFELYDLDADPRELVNLADDPKYRSVREELAGKLKRFQTETEDPWNVRYEYGTE